MDKVILYSETMDIREVESSIVGYVVTKVTSIRGLVSALAEEPYTASICLQSDRSDEDFSKLLSSIRTTFPKLNICVFTESPDTGSRVEGCHYIEIPAAGGISGVVKAYLNGMDRTDKRKYNRFSWPLEARILDNGGECESYRVHSLSAGGAFLEHERKVPPPESRCRMSIRFQNCRFNTEAEVLDARSSSSNLPFGFAVRFIDLDPESAGVIDKIVRNALVMHIIDPDAEPEIPSIGEDDLTFRFDLS